MLAVLNQYKKSKKSKSPGYKLAERWLVSAGTGGILP